MQKSLSHRFILKDLEHKKLFYDSKTILQEIVQAHYKEELFTIIWLEKRDRITIKRFQVELSDWTRQVYGSGKGRTKKSGRAGSCLQSTILMLTKVEYNVGVVCI